MCFKTVVHRGVKFTKDGLVMGNFMCPIDGAAGCLDIGQTFLYEGTSRRDYHLNW